MPLVSARGGPPPPPPHGCARRRPRISHRTNCRRPAGASPRNRMSDSELLSDDATAARRCRRPPQA
eukprot:3613590-Prymnesium_polylepis.1